MHHFVTEMCTHVYISVTKWCIVGYGTDAFWDLWDKSIATHANSTNTPQPTTKCQCCVHNPHNDFTRASSRVSNHRQLPSCSTSCSCQRKHRKPAWLTHYERYPLTPGRRLPSRRDCNAEKQAHWPLTRYVKLRMRREHFLRHQLQRKPRVSDPGMHHGMMHAGIANPRWRGKRSRHSRRMHNPQFYVSGKRPMSRRLHCPACRTTLVATRFRVAVICPIIQVPHCIRVFFYFVWFVFINHIFQFYYELCTYCNILDIYLS